MPEPAPLRIDLVGDAALLATLDDDLDLLVNARAQRVAATIEAARASIGGIGRPVPGHASVLVGFDPDIVDARVVQALLADAAAASHAADPDVVSAIHEIRVTYGGVGGPDLADVAARTGLSEAEVVRLHTAVEHRVLVIGFVPGFPYLGILPAKLELPRRATPRVAVPAGSVAIAGRQTGIYPFETPGGWHVIGRTDARLWDPERPEPSLLAPGDRVRLVPA